MNGHTHTAAEWAAFLSLGFGGWGTYSVFYFLLVESQSARDFDPRPAVRRIAGVVHQGAVHAGHDLNRAIATSQRLTAHALREAALTVAALLILTIPTGDPR